MSTPPPETPRLRVFRLGEEPPVDPYVLGLTEGQRMEMAWQLSREAWQMMGADPDAPFGYDVGRLVRGAR